MAFDVPGMIPVSSHQAALYMNGQHQTNCIGFKAVGTVDTKESRVIGQQTTKPRVRAVKFSGEMRFYKNSPWLAEYLKNVMQHQYTAAFDLMFFMDDDGSDYFKKFGKQKIQLTGCVITGDVTIMESNTNCDDLEETVQFMAEKMIA